MMRTFRRFLPRLAVVLGVLGTVACAAAIIMVWSAGTQLSRTNENVFDGIDKSLAAIRGRALGAQTRVQEAKLSTADVGQGVRTWAGKEASERLASRLEAEEKAERLTLGLQQADLWLETSEESLRGVQQTCEMASSLGAPVDAAFVAPLLEQLGAVRRQLQQSTETVAGIHELLAKTAVGEGLEGQTDDVARLVLRVVATLGEIDARLGEFADRLTSAQSKARRLESKTHTYIVVMASGAVLLIVWMMAGQVALYRRGRARAVAAGDHPQRAQSLS